MMGTLAKTQLGGDKEDLSFVDSRNPRKKKFTFLSGTDAMIKKNFEEKIGEKMAKIGVYTQINACLRKNSIISLVFKKKSQIFALNLENSVKIAITTLTPGFAIRTIDNRRYFIIIPKDTNMNQPWRRGLVVSVSGLGTYDRVRILVKVYIW
jgi:hypothetical protein